MIEKHTRAKILAEALPYIKKYNKKTVVVKYGGAAMTDPELKRKVLTDIVLLAMASIPIVIVHGGGPEINGWLGKMNIAPSFVDGLRYTDGEVMDVVQMTLAGKISKELVAMIHELGGKAMSLSGMDGNLMQARQLDPKYGQVGELTAINPEIIQMALQNGYIPIISTVATGLGGCSYNINADTAASALAAALGAEALILLTDVKGILKDPQDQDSLIKEMHVSQIPVLIKSGAITGGMIPKLECSERAIRRGVKAVHILDGRIPHSILMEILTDGGVGTMILEKGE